MPKKTIASPVNRVEDRIELPKYSDKEVAYRDFIFSRMEDAVNQRNEGYTELDDMYYEEYHETNKKAANSYIRPKKNDEDTRIVTGTTQEKGVTMLSSLLNFNFEANIEAFDEEDTVVHRLGEIMEAFIKKSRQIENYEMKRPLIYKEILDQGTAFIEEVWEEPRYIEKIVSETSWLNGVDLEKITWQTKERKQTGYCCTNLLSGLKVYLGNIHEFFIQKQPFLFTMETIPYEMAYHQFKSWSRFKNVPRQLVDVAPLDGQASSKTVYDNYSYLFPKEGLVNVIKYQDKPNNEYQLLLNGISMLPPEFPLTEVSPSGEYFIAKGDNEPISRFFAISKSTPAKTKVDQAVLDEFLRLMILKTQQSFQPPLANNTNRILSKNILLPGRISADINPDEIRPIINTTGVTSSEFNMYQMLRSVIDEKSVSPTFQGQALPGKQTAREIVALQKQSMMKLGQAILGVIQTERQLVELRLANIIKHWTKPIDEEIDETKSALQKRFRTISIDTTFDNGEKGKLVAELTTDEEKLNRSSEQVLAESNLMTKASGVHTRKVYINPKLLQEMKFTWYIDIVPTEKDSDEIDRALFLQNVGSGFQLFGREAFNLEFLKEQWALKNDFDPEKVLIKAQQQNQLAQNMNMMQQGGQPQIPGAQQRQPQRQPQGASQSMIPQRAPQAQMPSINTLAG